LYCNNSIVNMFYDKIDNGNRYDHSKEKMVDKPLNKMSSPLDSAMVDWADQTLSSRFKTTINNVKLETIKILPEDADDSVRCLDPRAWFNEMFTLIIKNAKCAIISLACCAVSPVLLFASLVMACFPRNDLLAHLSSAIQIIPLTLLSSIIFTIITIMCIVALIAIVFVVIFFLTVTLISMGFNTIGECCCSFLSRADQ